jgi:hypothetical protein
MLLLAQNVLPSGNEMAVAVEMIPQACSRHLSLLFVSGYLFKILRNTEPVYLSYLFIVCLTTLSVIETV